MANDTQAGIQRCRSSDFRRVDHLETGLCAESERLSDPGWVRLYGAISEGSYSADLVRSWLILAFFITSGSAAINALVARGRW